MTDNLIKIRFLLQPKIHQESGLLAARIYPTNDLRNILQLERHSDKFNPCSEGRARQSSVGCLRLLTDQHPSQVRLTKG